ncbi:MAG: beta-ketoacyl-ACP synthase II [Planctomycetota bacterium]|nr:beta-ketoacyl-ACP synthase II [Planctomycetota bacterium]
MSINSERRVVVTGIGAVTNIGYDVPTFWRSLCEGRSGIGPVTCFEQDERWLTRIAGEIDASWDPCKYVTKREIKKLDRSSVLGLYAAEEAALDSGIDFQQGDPYRRGVVIGSGVGGIQTIEEGDRRIANHGPMKVSPFTVPKLMVNALAGNVSIRFSLKGVNNAPATACATGAHALGGAFRSIARGDAEVILCGGTEAAVSPLCMASFGTMKALSTRNDEPEKASRPFDRDRDGFVLSEGAAVLVLEELEHAKSRGAEIYAEIRGFGCTCDAHHIAAPDPRGMGAQKAMEFSLRDAGINLEQIDYINAHGTSTPLGDAAEVGAVKSLFGDHAFKLAMCSTKSMTGHTLGAAGGIESIATILSVKNDIMVPTINLENPDDGFDLDFVPNEAQERKVDVALNNSFGFGGHNVSLCYTKYTGD